ncbi:MAG TPA: HlyD family secretion protein [Bryobacteraceae bacterium]|jgi:membrane fusion protein (multidrug efflux system)|nr:HlyD family secretion protein [Bryobacteraceae bacterium]
METQMIEEEKPVNELPKETVVRAPANRSKAAIAILGGGLVVALVAAGFWLHFRYRVSSDDAQVDGHIVPISAKVFGSVLDVPVNDNQAVKAGDVLARIDPRDLQAKLDQEKAALALAESQAQAAHVTVPMTRDTTHSGTSGSSAALTAAEAQVAQMEVGIGQATTDQAIARSNLAAAEASNEKGQADLARMRPLVAKAEISQQEFDSYMAAAKVTEAQLKAAQDRVRFSEQGISTAHAMADAARARVQQMQAEVAQSTAGERQVLVSSAQAVSAVARVQEARANVAAAQLNLSYTTIVSPADGVVTKKSVEPGQIVQPGQNLMAIIPLKDVWVTANFKETQLAKVHAGQPAEIEVDMYGRTIAGKVDSIAGGTGARMSLLPPENATGNFVKVVERIPVKIVFDSLPDGVILRPGMNVNATIITK